MLVLICDCQRFSFVQLIQLETTCEGADLELLIAICLCAHQNVQAGMGLVKVNDTDVSSMAKSDIMALIKGIGSGVLQIEFKKSFTDSNATDAASTATDATATTAPVSRADPVETVLVDLTRTDLTKKLGMFLNKIEGGRVLVTKVAQDGVAESKQVLPGMQVLKVNTEDMSCKSKEDVLGAITACGTNAVVVEFVVPESSAAASNAQSMLCANTTQ